MNKRGGQKMSVEERFLEAIAGDEEIETEMADRNTTRHQRLQRRNRVAIGRFLGDGRRAYQVGILPRYYGELLTWALKRYLEEEGWEEVQTLGYHGHEPVYIDVSTDYDSRENLLRDGQILVGRDESRIVVTVDINLQWRNSILLEGPAKRKEEIRSFVDGVLAIAHERNFYRGKKIEFAGRLRFLDLSERSWDSIILQEEIKKEIRANTIAFLGRKELWNKYGIPLKRGILLASGPGTGKTVICKALMAEAERTTCIAATAYALDDDEYITELYELAQDLSPCLVFIEDIDLIGQNRQEFGYQKGPALMSLLTVLDGIEEKKEIVTVATTNCLDLLDKALSERPSRFDRVIRLPRPSLEQRLELLRWLCYRMPLDEDTQEHIARRAEGCTPAQVQEIVHSLAIEHAEETPSSRLRFSKEAIDRIISRMNGRNRQLGFGISGNHDHNNLGQVLRGC
jgi:cell division protease FtsH